jgi:hypothetical protein
VFGSATEQGSIPERRSFPKSTQGPPEQTIAVGSNDGKLDIAIGAAWSNNDAEAELQHFAVERIF